MLRKTLSWLILTAVTLAGSVLAQDSIEFNGATHTAKGETRLEQVSAEELLATTFSGTGNGVTVDFGASEYMHVNLGYFSDEGALTFNANGTVDGVPGERIATGQLTNDGSAWQLDADYAFAQGTYTVEAFADGELVASFSGSEAMSVRSTLQPTGVGVGPAMQAGPGGWTGPCPFGTHRYYQCLVGPGPLSAHGGPCAAHAGFSISSALTQCCAQYDGVIKGTCSGPVGVICSWDDPHVVAVGEDFTVADQVVVVLEDPGRVGLMSDIDLEGVDAPTLLLTADQP